VLIEIQSRDQFAIHADVTEAVDSFLRGYPLPAENRIRDEDGKIRVEKAPAAPLGLNQRPQRGARPENGSIPGNGRGTFSPQPVSPSNPPNLPESAPRTPLQTVKIYPYGVARNRLMQAAKRLGVPAIVVREPSEADALITLRAYYRNRQQPIMEAESRGMPIYVLRANTVSQMEQFLSDLYNLNIPIESGGESDDARSATQQAIAAVLNGERYVDMPPASPVIRRIQHEMARAADLVSHSYGKEPRRYVRIFRD